MVRKYDLNRYHARHEDSLMWERVRKKAEERERNTQIRKDNKEKNRG